MSKVYKVPYPRTRMTLGITRDSVPVGRILTNFGTTPGTFETDTGGVRSTGNIGESRVCHDIVTPGFSEVINRGGIINNPFTSVSCVCTHGGSGQIVQYTGPLDPWQTGTYRGEYHATLRTFDARYLYGDVIPADGAIDVLALLSEVNISKLLTQSATSALSKVDQNLASGLVGIGELKETILSLAHPLAAIRKQISRYRKKWPKMRRVFSRDPSLAAARVIGDTSLTIANEYLAFYYGLLPMCRDIESYIDAYVKSGHQPARMTARGCAVDSVDNVTMSEDLPVTGSSYYSHRQKHKVDVEVRSGLLHELPPLTWQKVYGVRFSDFFDAAYQLTPWSFFVDYFSNLGTLINALAPRPGVRYLAAWDTIVATITDRTECTSTQMDGSWSIPRPNTEWSERVIKARVRIPRSPYENVGLALKLGNWSSKTKVLAAISLIIQQLPR